MKIKYYEDAKENAAFERCTDVITNMIMKYGPVLKRKWAVEEWLRSIHVECFWCKFRINGAPFSRQRCKRLAPAVRYPFIACL